MLYDGIDLFFFFYQFLWILFAFKSKQFGTLYSIYSMNGISNVFREANKNTWNLSYKIRSLNLRVKTVQNLLLNSVIALCIISTLGNALLLELLFVTG